MPIQKTIILFFNCLYISGVLQAQAAFNPDDLMTIVKEERAAHACIFISRNHEYTRNYDVKWYRCFWNIDPSLKEISGNVTTLFVPAEPGSDSLVFDLSQELTVDSVEYRSQSVAWQHISDLLCIRFADILPPLVADSITIYYHGVPPDNGSDSFIQDSHNGSPIIWTLSEPYGSSDWWPCKNGLSDKADSLDIYIRTPLGNKSASNGILVSVSQNSTHSLYHWKHRYPIATYLVCLAVTNYTVYEEKVSFGSDTLKVINFIYPEDSASVSAQTSKIIPMVQLFDSLFGIYPFQQEKYGHAQFGWGGGMEHQTMTFITSFGFELMAHELAHQWFGNKVTCGSWTDVWLNEGFGTYLSGLCYEHLLPEYWQRFREVRVKSIISKPGGSVYCNDTTDINRIFDGRLSYSKGAMILHQLRWIMGDSIFFSALYNYLHDFRLAYGFARTDDLKSQLESSFGQDLTEYFDAWFKGEGYPSYQINWSQAGDTISFTISQTQSHSSVSFFTLPLQLMFKNAERDTLIRVSNTFSGQLFTLNIPFNVDSVIFDPYCQIISGNNTISSVKEHLNHSGLRIYPNPARDRLTFSFTGSPPKDRRTIYIYDQSGQLKDMMFLVQGQSEINLSTMGYTSGLYFYVLSHENIQTSGKFSINH